MKPQERHLLGLLQEVTRAQAYARKLPAPLDLPPAERAASGRRRRFAYEDARRAYRVYRLAVESTRPRKSTDMSDAERQALFGPEGAAIIAEATKVLERRRYMADAGLPW